jgi:zinc transporter
MIHTDGSSGQALIYGFDLDGKGGGTQLGWSDIQGPPTSGGLTWIHLDLAAPETSAYVRARSGLEEEAADVLLAEHTRPRIVQFDDGVVVILRGINFNPGAEPDDMVSIRIWASEHLVVSCRKLPLLAVQDVSHAIERERGPCNSGELLATIADRLAERMDDVIEGLEDESDALEERVEEGQIKQINAALADLRRTFIGLRRYLTPQRDALLRLAAVKPDWLAEEDRNWLRELADQTTRYLEALEAARDRATVTQEELLQRLSEKTEQRMYLLSVVTAVFLPLGLITGILGVNVGGIPGAETPWAFLLLCVITACLLGLELWYLRRNRWF